MSKILLYHILPPLRVWNIILYSQNITVSTSRCWCVSLWWFLTRSLSSHAVQGSKTRWWKMCSRKVANVNIYSLNPSYEPYSRVGLDYNDPWTGASPISSVGWLCWLCWLCWLLGQCTKGDYHPWAGNNVLDQSLWGKSSRQQVEN